jgi:hypothetical protein
MADVAELRAGLAENLTAIEGMNVAEHPPTAIHAPVAYLDQHEADFDEHLNRGLDLHTFSMFVVVSRDDDTAGRRSLDALKSPSGTQSVKAALEADDTLGGRFAYQEISVRCTSAAPADVYAPDGDALTQYLAAAFTIQVYAPGE